VIQGLNAGCFLGADHLRLIPEVLVLVVFSRAVFGGMVRVLNVRPKRRAYFRAIHLLLFFCCGW
jgi:hypothetical protein